MAVAFPSIAVSQSTSETTSNNLSIARFGNGYEQVVQNGINYIRARIGVQWNNLNTTDKNTIVTFIKAISDGTVTTWTDPFDGVAKKWRIDGDWSISNRGGTVWAISLNLKQVYDL